MRGNVPQYDMRLAASLKEALHLLSEKPHTWQPFAGGTDLMVVFETGILKQRKFLSIHNLKELKGIKKNKTHLVLGALTTYSEIRKNKFINKYFPLLVGAAQSTGAIAIQNRGTLGGNLANASPAADTPPALLAYDAEVEVSSVSGSRVIPYSQFHGGYKKIDLNFDELITQVRIPLYDDKRSHYYRKVGTRKAQAISKICFAGVVQFKGKRIVHVRIGLGSVAPVPLRCLETEALLTNQKLTENLVGKAQQILLKEITPIDDIRSSADYRRHVTANLLREFLCGTGSIN